MKLIYLTIGAILCTQFTNAQTPITLSSSPTITVGKIDSCNLPTPAALSNLISLAPAINGSWDIGTIPLQTAPFTYAYKAKTAGFSAATFSDSTSYTFGTSAFGFSCWRNIQQSATGVKILGEEITKRQAKSLGPATGNNVDSIVFGQQAISYATPLPILKFPATMNSNWAATTDRIVNFTVTATALGLNNTPGQQKQVHTTVDSVVGWGVMKVPIVGKGSSSSIAVLQIHHFDVSVDSFFINGAAAPAAVLTALGSSQGQSTTVARTYFYRAAAYRPLVEAVHSTPSHSSSVSKLYMHAIDLPEPTSVAATTALGEIRIYPLPVHNGQLHIDIPTNNTSGWSYSIINMNGRQIANGSLPLDASKHTAAIDLPQTLPSGIYYLTLLNQGKQLSVLPLTIE